MNPPHAGLRQRGDPAKASLGFTGGRSLGYSAPVLPKDLLEPLGLDALLVTRPENVRYLSGFPHPEDAQVLVTGEGAFLLTDPRYPEAERESRIPAKVLKREEREALLKTLKGRVGFEAEHLPYAALERLEGARPRRVGAHQGGGGKAPAPQNPGGGGKDPQGPGPGGGGPGPRPPPPQARGGGAGDRPGGGVLPQKAGGRRGGLPPIVASGERGPCPTRGPRRSA